MEHDLPTTLNLERQLNDLALAAGRKRQSQQSGYLHLFYSVQDEEVHHTIPLVENVYFVLALFRSKTSEHMVEAKELLNRLLFFQDPVDGNFPIYVHEYPQCKDRFLGVQILPVFYYILDEFHTILGQDLKQRLLLAASKLMYHTLKSYDEKKPSYALGFKLAAAAKCFGSYLKDSVLENRGEQLLQEYYAMGLQPAWFIPTSIADICIALQMVYKSIQESPWKDFWKHLSHTWHLPTGTYAGPGLKQYQQGEQPQPTLYDLFLGYFSQSYSERALKEAPYHLQAVLIRATEDTLPLIEYPFSLAGTVQESPWFIFQSEQFSYSLVNNLSSQNPATANAFHPFMLLWGDRQKVHTFVCQGGNFHSFNFSPQGHEIELIMKLASTYEVEDREKCRELAFYFDVEPDLKMAIHGESATTFNLSEEFVLTTPRIEIKLAISLIKGEGQFLGHLMKGNRTCQTQLKGENRYKAYDWQVFFRTLRRHHECLLKTNLHIRYLG